jgi:lipid II:glycine glycyltransferase (peptidoglycan interpeptide bridge formation enzyme)
LFLEIRNSHAFSEFGADPVSNGFEYLPYENYLIHLGDGMERIWESLNSYTRNHIRKGQKRGAVVREATDSEFDEAIRLLEKLYSEKKIPFIGASTFQNAHRILTPLERMRTTVMQVDGRIIGARITLQYARTMFDWYASYEAEFRGYYPNEALVWDAMAWAHEHGYRAFDFGGAGMKGQAYGPAVFKEKFRGEKVEFGRYRYPSNRLLYFLARKAYALRTRNSG